MRLRHSRAARAAAWGLCAALLALGLLAQLRQRAFADVEHGRERLLAGDVAAAGAAFGRAWRWPGAGESARAGLEWTAARSGLGADATRPGIAGSVPAEALVLSAFAAGDLDAAASLARLMRHTGDPLGPLYAAVAALESGDEPAAREAAAASRVPLTTRGLGARLELVLAARDAGARSLFLDASGELVATADAGGLLRESEAAAGLVPGLLERLSIGGLVERLSVGGLASAETVASSGPAVPEPGDRVPTIGPAVRLAIDLELSRAALWALGDARGSIVLVDARSGAVRAAVSDALTVAREGAAAFAQRREPASIAKVLTAAAAYRAGIDPDTAIARMTCGGVERYGGVALWCPDRGGPLAGLDEALAQSCNLAFANVGTRLGAHLMTDEYRRWGFDVGAGGVAGRAGTGIGGDSGAPSLSSSGSGASGSAVSGSGVLGSRVSGSRVSGSRVSGSRVSGSRVSGSRVSGSGVSGSGVSGSGVSGSRVSGSGVSGSALSDSAGRLHTAPGTPRQLADLSIGLEVVDVTPLHAALLAAVVANDGRMPEPRLLTGGCGPLGIGGSPADTAASREVLDPAVARRLRRAMEAVTRSGTGAFLAPPEFEVAMKTGTAAERGQGYHVNYIGFGPLPEASLAFCVRVTHERTSPAVTREARAVTRRLLAALASRRKPGEQVVK